MGHRPPSPAAAYAFGCVFGIPAFVVFGKVFCWVIPAIAAAGHAL